MNTRLVVGASAAAAFLLRFPGAVWPIRPDESGFTLVARHWDPQPDSIYGTYWVDRPPPLIALVKLADWIGGPLFLRLVAAVGCALLVLAAAATARQLLVYAGRTDERLVSRTGAWTAMLTAAFATNAMIDSVQAKPELLGIPFGVTGFWLALRAMNRTRRSERVDRGAVLLAAGAGLASAMAVGMKQNLVAGLVFGGVLLLGSRVVGRLTTSQFWKLGGAAMVGAAVPVAATVGWAVLAGVHLDAMWYALYGFRSDALDVIRTGSRGAPKDRALLLLGVLAATGMAFVVAGVLNHRRRIWRLDPVLATATGLVVAVDFAGVVLGGSYWRAYLFVLVPGMVLCTAMLLGVRLHVARRARLLVALAMACAVVSSLVWAGLFLRGVSPPTEIRSGEAIGEAARPGDTLTVYGGRADIVLSSGLPSPYEYLWSLPMRTLDPEVEQLEALLDGPDAPTWFVPWVKLTSWEGNGLPLVDEVRENYDLHGLVCEGRPVYLLEGLSRPEITPDCD